MEIQTEMTKKETHYLIDLLNKDYVQLRKFKEQLLINTPPEIVAEDVKLLIDKCQTAMDDNETLTHKFDDHLTDIGRGRKLNG
tara:strand:+ start:44 stop:292 length:249 start_codon:yes stop_codon:yes gene_type:complete